MFLKSLSLKGFKSFADATVVEFQPGVTVVVGPNGSGKSNVVDAVAWVLGAQSARVVRSSRMDDVIFAGANKRPALGRAEVALTIDNSAGKLAIDFSEVTVSRTLFRTGESEYAINGVACRLLDVQELFSDTGVGRQQHVIISQGQLDAILGARPEERRMVVEEAAGVLKYRRRKERAERRLEASETSLSRLVDLQRELRRQLRPLERQAASALRHEELTTELRALRLYLAGKELRELTDRLGATGREAAEAERASTELDQQLVVLDGRLAEAQATLGSERAEDLSPHVATAERLGERADGLASLCRERRRARAELLAALASAEEVAALDAELHRARAELERCDHEAATLVPEWERLAESEWELAAREAADLERFGAEPTKAAPRPSAPLRVEQTRRREALSRLREAEVRATERLEALGRRRQSAAARLERAEQAVAALAPALEGARRDEADASARLTRAEQAGQLATVGRQAAEEEHHSASARAEVLALALEEARARAGLERVADLPGVLGTLLDVVEVDDEVAPAFEAAVAGTLDAVLVERGEPARAALDRLRSGGQGGALVPVGGHRAPGTVPPPPPGSEALLSSVRAADPAIRALLERLCAGVVVVRGGFEVALELALVAPEHTIVTTEGDRLAPTGWRIGAGSSGVTRAAYEAARSRAEHAAAALGAALASAEGARQQLEAARRAANEAVRSLDRLGAELERAERDANDARGELAGVLGEEQTHLAARADAQRAAAAGAIEVGQVEAELAELEANEQEAAERAGAAQAARREREERGRALGALRRDLEVRAAALEERRNLLTKRAEELGSRLQARADERDRAEERRLAHHRDDLVLSRLAGALAAERARLDEALARLRAERDRRAEQARGRLEAVHALRAEREARERTLAATRQRAQRLELERTELRVRHETAVEGLARDLEAAPDEALGAERPASAATIEPAERLRELERELRLLGPVNPLAREELVSVQERSAFVENQLEDVRNARRELGQVIRAIDSEIIEVFAAAFGDVERHFETLIALLFPGGSGRLYLTAPDDLLATGIEIEARPAGRNVRRLSLLSGGERSMVALAFLFAVFRSRPSPFYLLDEVEAALDEVNLRRFLSLLGEFRNEAQLIVVSHQKRTMEVADALYGVSMQPGGGSKIVSERLRPAAEVS